MNGRLVSVKFSASLRCLGDYFSALGAVNVA